MKPRTLILLAKAPAKEIPSDLKEGNIPRIEYIELARALDAVILDFHDVSASRHPAVRAARKKSPYYGLAVMGLLRRREFENIYATGEDIGMPLAALFHAVRDYGRLTVVIHQCDTPKRRLIMRALGPRIWGNVICLAEEQRRILTEELGLPRHLVHRFDQWIDPLFFTPDSADSRSESGEYAFSCGRESRDYLTLQRAAETLPYSFRVVASGWAPHAGFDAAVGITARSNVDVITGLSYRELRDAYEGSRFVIVPLNRITYAAGVTSVCEGMAMGKAIIVSDSPGIRDYVDPGISGLVVPVGDEVAMRQAIRELWENPKRCAIMGAHNRRWVEQELNVDRYVERVGGLFGIRGAHAPTNERDFSEQERV